uniref:Uncharacterized protein n=1 Tax=Glossina brevipalpis TaxID=37001 RepID=A0A1A9WV70_9MUSC
MAANVSVKLNTPGFLSLFAMIPTPTKAPAISLKKSPRSLVSVALRKPCVNAPNDSRRLATVKAKRRSPAKSEIRKIYSGRRFFAIMLMAEAITATFVAMPPRDHYRYRNGLKSEDSALSLRLALSDSSVSELNNLKSDSLSEPPT